VEKHAANFAVTVAIYVPSLITLWSLGLKCCGPPYLTQSQQCVEVSIIAGETSLVKLSVLCDLELDRCATLAVGV